MEQGDGADKYGQKVQRGIAKGVGGRGGGSGEGERGGMVGRTRRDGGENEGRWGVVRKSGRARELTGVEM